MVQAISPVRFQGLLYELDMTRDKGQAKATAYVGDYRRFGYQDGSILVRKPSGKLMVLDADVRSVAELTQELRADRAFSLSDRRDGFIDYAHRGVSNIFLTIRRRFERGMWPQTQLHKDGRAFFQDLFEKPYEEGTIAAECVLTSALGHKYAVEEPARWNRNNRRVYIDKGAAKLQSILPVVERVQPLPEAITEAEHVTSA